MAVIVTDPRQVRTLICKKLPVSDRWRCWPCDVHMYILLFIGGLPYVLKGTLSLMLIKIQPDATVCIYLFTAESLYMFRVSQHSSSGVLKTVPAASGTGHNTDLYRRLRLQFLVLLMMGAVTP